MYRDLNKQVQAWKTIALMYVFSANVVWWRYQSRDHV